MFVAEEHAGESEAVLVEARPSCRRPCYRAPRQHIELQATTSAKKEKYLIGALCGQVYAKYAALQMQEPADYVAKYLHTAAPSSWRGWADLSGSLNASISEVRSTPIRQ